MKPTQLASALSALLPTRRPLYLWGPPGVGKSSLVRQAAEANGLELIDVRAVLLDPVDLRGLPAVRDGRAEWALPSFLPHDRNSKGVLFLDELAQSPPLVQSACAAPEEILLGDNVPIRDVTVGATVLGMRGQLQGVSQTFKRPYQGQMVRIKPRLCLPFSVTPDHPVAVCDRSTVREGGTTKYSYSSPRWVAAGEIKPGDCLMVPKLQGRLVTAWVLFGDYIQSAQSKTPAPIRDGVPLNEELAELFGYYLAEGCHSLDGGFVQLAFHEQETDLVERSVDLVKRLLGYEAKVAKMKDCAGVSVRFGGCVLAKFFADHFGHNARERRIPDFLLYHSNERLLRALLLAYWKGDGWHAKSASRLHMVTASRILAMQLQLLCGRLGVLVSVQKRKVAPRIIRGRKTRGGSAYVLSSSMAEAMALVRISKRKGLSRPTKHYGEVEGVYGVPVTTAERYDHDGFVYDVTTEDHSLVLSNVITHNCLQLTLDRKIGDYTLPTGWTVVAASNRQEDRAGAHRLISPLLNRFVHLDLHLDLADWQAWATGAGIAPEVRAFLNFKPGLLFTFDPAENQRAFASPRSWHFIHDVLAHTPEPLQHDVFSGCVGDGPAVEFLAFLRVYRDLPDIDTVLAKADTITIPASKPDVMYALTGALAERSKSLADLGPLATFALRKEMPGEFSALLLRDTFMLNSYKDNGKMKGKDKLFEKKMSQWLAAHRDVLTPGRD